MPARKEALLHFVLFLLILLILLMMVFWIKLAVSISNLKIVDSCCISNHH